MPSFRAGREVDVEVVDLKEVYADNVLAGAGDDNHGLVDARGRGRIAKLIAIGKRDEHLLIVGEDIRAGDRRQSHIVGWREDHVRRAAIEER
jgi:hypothetical protein